MAQLNMDLHETETSTTYEPIPAGDYLAQIIDSEIKESKTGTHYIKFIWEIMDEKCRGRQVFENVSLSNLPGKRYEPGQSPAEIGQRKLKTIAVCGNHPNPNFLKDTEELHNLPIIIKIKTRQDEQYGAQNDVKGYRPARTVAPVSTDAAPAPAEAAPAKPKAAAPAWMQAAR